MPQTKPVSRNGLRLVAKPKGWLVAEQWRHDETNAAASWFGSFGLYVLSYAIKHVTDARSVASCGLAIGSRSPASTESRCKRTGRRATRRRPNSESAADTTAGGGDDQFGWRTPWSLVGHRRVCVCVFDDRSQLQRVVVASAGRCASQRRLKRR